MQRLMVSFVSLGMMLGSPRPGVTLAVQALEKEGLIDTRRARIIILGRKALEKRSNGTYVQPHTRGGRK